MTTNDDWYSWTKSIDKENVLYSFPAFESVGRNNAGDEREQRPPLVLQLVPLPYLSDDYELMPVGARGWYASAILSAMMMSSYSSRNDGNCAGEESKESDGNTGNLDIHDNPVDEKNQRTPKKGIDLLREDLKRACANGDSASSKTGGNSNNVFLELGSGTIGLAGMTLAWIIAQHQSGAKDNHCGVPANNKVILTDYDQMCLEQLERNTVGVRRTLGNYFSDLESNEDKAHVHRKVQPDIDVLRLDWNEYDQDQSPVLPDNDTKGNCDPENHTISFACGAALVYTESTGACADQVAKILRLHPNSVVWVVQWPRGGWFNVFQQQLLSERHKRDDLNICIQNFGPKSSPELFSNEVQDLAIQLMPEDMHQECRLNMKHLRAIRITNCNEDRI